MKLTKEQLVTIIEEELAMIEVDDGEKVMAAIADTPKTANTIADKTKEEIESLAEPSGLDPSVLAQAVAALLTAD